VQVLHAETVAPLVGALRQLLWDAFEGDFSDDDWQHTLGGWHAVALDGDALVSHAAVVPRTIQAGDRAFRAGYVEGVATRPDRQREGLAAAVMAEVSTVLRARFELGVLSTSSHDFYQRLGWEHWQGPTFVRAGGQLVRTEDEDDGIMVLRFGPSQEADVTAPISCESRTGDDW
jgi:aminoglycoside 2'-N-acetyltransferase I